MGSGMQTRSLVRSALSLLLIVYTGLIRFHSDSAVHLKCFSSWLMKRSVTSSAIMYFDDVPIPGINLTRSMMRLWIKSSKRLRQEMCFLIQSPTFFQSFNCIDPFGINFYLITGPQETQGIHSFSHCTYNKDKLKWIIWVSCGPVIRKKLIPKGSMQLNLWKNLGLGNSLKEFVLCSTI